MKTLSLIIKREFFDKILSGEKKTETREIRPKTAGRYIYYENLDNGQKYAPKDIDNAPESEKGYSYGAIQYDAIQLYVGYAKNRPGALVEVKGSEIYQLTDEDGQPIIYESEGNEYYLTQIEYTLGKVLSKTNC